MRRCIFSSLFASIAFELAVGGNGRAEEVFRHNTYLMESARERQKKGIHRSITERFVFEIAI